MAINSYVIQNNDIFLIEIMIILREGDIKPKSISGDRFLAEAEVKDKELCQKPSVHIVFY